MRYLYGPVKSRRLGLSLGVSLTPYKVCNFDCVYCQLGVTTHKSIERKEYIPAQEILEELKSWLKDNPSEASKLNYITFSGSGEPTLNIRIGELIESVKKVTGIPVAVITNAASLSSGQARRALLLADLVVPSLDAVTANVFARVDRPHPDLKIEDIIEGLVSLRKEFRKKIWLEVMLVKGFNDDLRHIKRLSDVIERINPDKIQLNSPVRATTEEKALPVDKIKLNKIKKILGEKAEII